MTGITHKQAGRYMRKALDGLLTDSQSSDLAAHLNECEACRLESESLSLLTARLKNNFQARWDTQNGPSHNVIANIHSQSRRISMSNRINTGLRTLAGIAALVMLGFVINYAVSQTRNTSVAANGTQNVVAATSTFSTQTNRLIAFVSEQNSNSEIYTMNTDGSDIRNITNNPAYDGNPVWSPDGSKITFESDRNGNRDIFMVNADGSGLIQLTNDPANDVLGPFPQPQSLGYKTPDVFSPDGNHILFANDKSGQWKLYVMNADGSGVTQLVQANDPLAADGRWSPDGKQIAYSLSNASGLTQMIAFNSDGTNRRAITVVDPAKGDIAQMRGSIIGWSQDDKSLYYEYDTGSGNWYIIKATTDGSGTIEKVADGYALDTGLFIDGWLGSNSVLSYVTNETGGKYGSRLHNTQNGKTLSWNYLVSCGYILPGSSRQPNIDGDSPSEKLGVSKTGSLAVQGVSCPNKGYSELYSLDSNSATIAKIAQIPTVWDTININWSADDQTVLIQGNDKSGKTDLYVLNAEELQKKSPASPESIWSGESSEALLQPVPFNGLTVKKPSTVVPSTQTTSITAPLWTGTSKGDLIAYVSTANGNSDIYLSKSDGTGVTNLTHRSADDFDPTWSPDGNMLSFASGVNGKYSLHIMRPDGSNEKQIADTWWGYAWSPDSTKIAYLVSLPDNPSDPYSPAKISIKVIDLNGNTLQDTALGTYNKADQLKWSQDGQSLSYVVTQLSTTPVGEVRTTESDLYQLKLGSDSPVLLVKSDKTIDAWTMRGDTLTYLIRDYIEWNLFQINNNGQKKLATFGFDQIKCGVGANQASQFTYNYGSENTTKNFSPNGKYTSFQVLCDDGSVWLYLGSTDGNFFKLIYDQPIDNNNLTNLLSWSSDSKNIVFSAGGSSIGNSNIYKMNIDSAIQNPAISPVPLTTSGFDEHNPVWQPKP